ncbi:DUF4870 domain-containing protein [Zhouia sp. PK063]|uniref:DUF4870 domain-containing protein n=1 Tax=Zhouia sp. PK063 TaxID=3373602 RepID=UPI0037BB6B84
MDYSELQKRVKESRLRQGLSQEELADKAQLSLRTVQRIENGASVPRGDTLKRLAVALQTSPDDLIEWKVTEDKNLLLMLNLSQLGFLAFPLLGIIIPLAIWALKKDKIRSVDVIGKSILNYQITWTILLCFIFFIPIFNRIFQHMMIPVGVGFLIIYYFFLYFYNIVLIVINTVLIHKKGKVKYVPAIPFLR